jgi:hypothetical protein
MMSWAAWIVAIRERMARSDGMGLSVAWLFRIASISASYALALRRRLDIRSSSVLGVVVFIALR